MEAAPAHTDARHPEPVFLAVDTVHRRQLGFCSEGRQRHNSRRFKYEICHFRPYVILKDFLVSFFDGL